MTIIAFRQQFRDERLKSLITAAKLAALRAAAAARPAQA